jgi:hypothetical protein
MSDSFAVLACDGLLEFEEADIEDVSTDERGTHVLLKTGLVLLLAGHESAPLLERLAEKARPAIA